MRLRSAVGMNRLAWPQAAATPEQRAALREASAEDSALYVRFALQVADRADLTPASSEEIARTALENHDYGVEGDLDGLSDVLQEMLVNLPEGTERATASRAALAFMADRVQGPSHQAALLAQKLVAELEDPVDVHRVAWAALDLAPAHRPEDNVHYAYHLVFRPQEREARVRIVPTVVEWLRENPPRPEMAEAFEIALDTARRSPQAKEHVLFAVLEKSTDLGPTEDPLEKLCWAIYRNIYRRPDAPRVARDLLLSLHERAPSQALGEALEGWSEDESWVTTARIALRKFSEEREAARQEAVARQAVEDLAEGLQPHPGEITRDRPGYVTVGGVDVPVRVTANRIRPAS